MKRPTRLRDLDPLDEESPLPGAFAPTASGPASGGADTEALERWRALGDPPSDHLGAVEWAFQAMTRVMREAMLDPQTTNERSRRKELRETSLAMQRLVPYDRIQRAAGMVRGDADALTTTTGGPELEDAPPFPAHAGRPTAKRGRPPKRPVP